MLFRRFISQWLVLTIMLAMGLSAHAQMSDPKQPRVLIGGTGTSYWRNDHWSMARLSLENPTTVEQQLLAVAYFDTDSNLQFTRPALLPPQSRRIHWLPMRNGSIPEGAKSAPVTTLLIDRSGAADVEISREPGLFRVDDRRPATGVISDSEDDPAIDVLVAMREQLSLSKGMIYISATNIPAIDIGWANLDNMLISRDDLQLDDAQLIALRNWLLSGGKLWVMLDQVKPELMQALLQEHWHLQVIDHVTLTELTVEGSSDPLTRTFEQPVRLTRMIVPDKHPTIKVLHTLQGWPVSITQKVGLGEIYITTLDPRVWLDDKTLLDPTQDLADFFTVDLNPVNVRQPLPAQVLENYLAQQIGYRVVSRQTVALILISFCGLILLSGLWLAHRQRLERIGWVGAALAVVCSVMLISLGALNRQGVPQTMASAQIAQVITPRHALVTGTLSVYSPLEEEGPLETLGGGIIWPDTSLVGGQNIRMTWTDLDRWEWNGLKFPSGAVRHAQVFSVRQFVQPHHALARFTADGLRVVLDPSWAKQMKDPIIATPQGKLAVQVSDAQRGIYQCSMEDQLPDGQFHLGGMLSDEARRRQEVYRALFPVVNQMPDLSQSVTSNFDQPISLNRRFPQVATLLGWGEPLDLSFHLSPKAVKHDSALLSVPLTFERSEVGTQVAIPSAFIPFAIVRGPQGTSTATIYNPNTKQWVGTLSQGITAFFRFQLPESVLPLQVQKVRVQLLIRAPNRKLELLGINAGQVVTLKELAGPLDSLTLELEAGPHWQLDEQGGLLLGLRVGDTPNEESGLWLMYGIGVDVTGQTLPLPPDPTVK